MFAEDEGKSDLQTSIEPVIPATYPPSMKCRAIMSWDPDLHTTPFQWNKALA